MNSKLRIFINYRREDSAGYAGRLFDRLEAHFGEDSIFMDIDDIEPGQDFVKVIQDAVESYDVLIALIGRRWASIEDDEGRRRLDDPDDFVRLEITTAIERDIRVIPVLVGGAKIPRASDLPEEMEALRRRNALEISDTRFHHDADRLIAALEAIGPEQPTTPKPSPAPPYLERLRKLPWAWIAGGLVGLPRPAHRPSERRHSSLPARRRIWACCDADGPGRTYDHRRAGAGHPAHVVRTDQSRQCRQHRSGGTPRSGHDHQDCGQPRGRKSGNRRRPGRVDLRRRHLGTHSSARRAHRMGSKRGLVGGWRSAVFRRR